jgi:hypothetical protein
MNSKMHRNVGGDCKGDVSDKCRDVKMNCPLYNHKK